MLKRVLEDGATLQIGVIAKLGGVILDSRSQMGLAHDQARLWVINQKCMKKFRRSVFESKVQLPSEEEADLWVRQYLAMPRRTTHCYRCQQDLNSVDYSACDRCRWIMCECGACGCEYAR